MADVLRSQTAGRPPAFRNSFFRVRGGAVRPVPFWGRLLDLKANELAFVAAGSGALLLAPLAEHLISRPEPEHRLEAGVDPVQVPFPEEDLKDGLAPAAADGRVIKPLQAPNPLTMIVAALDGEAPEPSPGPEGAPVSQRRERKDWKSALSSAARRGAAKAGRAARLPRPDAKLRGGLKGLSSLSSSGGRGSSSTSLVRAPRLDAPTSRGLTGTMDRPAAMTPVKPLAGFRGTAGGPAGAAPPQVPVRPDQAPAAAETQAEFLVPADHPSTSAGTGAAGGSPTEGESDKAPSAGASPDTKTIGESLGSQRAKMEMQKAVDLKYAKREYDELGKRKMLDQIQAQTASQLALKALDIAGQLANTALQGLLNQGQGQGQGGGRNQAGAAAPPRLFAPPDAGAGRGQLMAPPAGAPFGSGYLEFLPDGRESYRSADGGMVYYPQGVGAESVPQTHHADGRRRYPRGRSGSGGDEEVHYPNGSFSVGDKHYTGAQDARGQDVQSTGPGSTKPKEPPPDQAGGQAPAGGGGA